MSNRKTDLANKLVKKEAKSKTASDPLDTAAIILDTDKVEALTKSLPKIRKIKKEAVEIESSVTTVSTSGTKAPSLDNPPVDPNIFLNLDEDNADAQVSPG